MTRRCEYNPDDVWMTGALHKTLIIRVHNPCASTHTHPHMPSLTTTTCYYYMLLLRACLLEGAFSAALFRVGGALVVKRSRSVCPPSRTQHRTDSAVDAQGGALARNSAMSQRLEPNTGDAQQRHFVLHMPKSTAVVLLRRATNIPESPAAPQTKGPGCSNAFESMGIPIRMCRGGAARAEHG
eukprot:8302154-Pyramimonas_sp.AAC.2